MLPLGIDGGSKIRLLIGEILREPNRKACLQPRGLPLLRATEKARDVLVLRMGEGLSFELRLGSGREWMQD